MATSEPDIPAWLDDLCDRFEASWGTQKPIAIELVLNTISPARRSVVLKALLQLEYELRSKAGNTPSATELTDRFPDDTQIVDSVLRNPMPSDSLVGRELAGRETVAPRSTPVDGDLVPTRGGLQLPRQLGRYRIIRKLGQGAMASVFLAHDEQLDRQVALKIPRGDLQRSREMRLRFEREAQAAAALHHPNICAIHDIGEFKDIHFICMAYIDGFPLTRYAIAESGLTEQRIAELVLRLAKALATAHEAGFIHRDLKPANVMMDHDDEPVILDFGLARRVDRNDDLRVTQTGATIGSPAYMSPEQVDGDQANVGPHSDLYSLGVILYELLTGRIPFEGSMAAVMGQIMTKEPVKPSTYRRGLTVRLENICLKMMAKDSGKRHPSMHAVAAALQEYLDRYTDSSAASIEHTSGETPAVDVGTQRSQQIERLISAGDYGRAEKLMVALSRETDVYQIEAANWAAAELPKLRKTRAEVRAGRQEMYTTASQLMKARDYEQAARLLEEYPCDLRTPRMQELLEAAEAAMHQVQRLKRSITAGLNRADNAAVIPLLRQLLELKPADRQANELYDRLTRKPSGPISAVLGSQQPKTLENMSARFQWVILLAAVLLVTALPAYYWADSFLKEPLLKTRGVVAENKAPDPAEQLKDAAQDLPDVKADEVEPVAAIVESITAVAPIANAGDDGATPDDQPVLEEDSEVAAGEEKMEAEHAAVGTHVVAAQKSKYLDPDWLEQRLAEVGVDKLIEEFSGQSNEDARMVRSALDLSRHILRDHPSAFREQMQARLVSVSTRSLGQFQVLPVNKGFLRSEFPTFDQAGGPLLRTLKGHVSNVACVAVTPDGKRAISGSSDNTLKVWNLETGQEIRTLKGHAGAVACVAVTPDGKRAISGSSWHDALKVWVLETGQEIRTLKGHIRGVAVTPDSTRAISGSLDNTLTVWELNSGELIKRYYFDHQPYAVALAENGRDILLGSPSGTLHKLTMMDETNE